MSRPGAASPDGSGGTTRSAGASVRGASGASTEPKGGAAGATSGASGASTEPKGGAAGAKGRAGRPASGATGGATPWAAFERAASSLIEATLRDPRVLEAGAHALRCHLLWRRALDATVEAALASVTPGRPADRGAASPDPTAR